MVAEVCGDGPPILLLHGIPGSRATWRRVVDRLGSDVHTVVPDMLGFGDSSDPAGDFHASAQAEALAKFMEQLGHDTFHLVGFDFGGPAAILLAGLRPQRVRSLVLISTNAFPDAPIPGLLKMARYPLLGDAVLLAKCSVGGLLGMWLGAAADKRSYSLQRFLEELPDRRGRRWTRRVFLDSLRHLGPRYAPVAKVLPLIGCPTLVVWGDRDPFFPVAVGERTARAIGGARLHVLPGCGHFGPGERPAALAALIRSQATATRQDL
jgi:pimeloyl-ACP methyl ester carboxylesterase